MTGAATRRLLALLRERRPRALGPASFGAVVAASAAVGTLLAPQELAPTRAGNVTHWGGWALESAFAGMVLAAALVTFRAHEILFRSHDAGALRVLPLSPGAVAADRLRVTLSDSLFAGLIVASFVAPALLRPGGELAVASLAFVVVSAACAAFIGFGTIAGAAAATAESGVARSRPASSAAAFHMGPGVAFGACAACFLLLKLGFEEPLRQLDGSGAPTMTRAGWLAIGLSIGGAAATGAWGFARYAPRHDEIQALFLDAESHRVDNGYAHFAGEDSAGGVVQRRLGPVTGALYAKDRMQLARSAPFVRAGTWLVLALGLLVGWAAASAASPALLGLASAGWAVFAVAPYRRAGRLPGESRFGLADMLADVRQRTAARRAAAGAELARHALPLTACGLGLGLHGALAAASYVAAGCASSALAARVLPDSEFARAAAFVSCVAPVGIAAAFGPWMAAPLYALSLSIAGVGVWASGIADLPSTPRHV